MQIVDSSSSSAMVDGSSQHFTIGGRSGVSLDRHHFTRIMEEEEQDDENEDESNNNNINNDDDEDGATATTADFIPSLEGYLTLEFSLFVSELANDVVTLTQQNVKEIEEGLDSLLLLFLCSKNVDMVISPDPDSLVSVCPFQDDNGGEDNEDDGQDRRRLLADFLENMGQQFRRALQSNFVTEGGYDVNNPTGMVLWNVPKVDSEVLLLSSSGDDMLDGQFYFTKWVFTYPVYNWGPFVEDGESPQYDIQSQLDESILAGTFDTVMPWDDTQASLVGQELETFGRMSSNSTGDNEYYDEDVVYYDNEIPQEKANLLQGIGSLMVIFNTIFLILITVLAKKHRIRKQVRAKERVEVEASGLDTEEGVTEMLLESKMFAMEKSQELRVLEQQRSRTVDTASSSNLGRAAAPAVAITKQEKSLVHKAKNHQHAYEDRLLATNKSMEEEEADDHVDFRPPSPFRRQSKIPRTHHTRRKSSHNNNKPLTEEEC